MKSARHTHRWDWPVLLILAVGTALRFLALGQQSLWHDEIRSVTIALGGPENNILWAVLNIHGPLYLVLLKGWMALVGTGEGATRALSAALGAAGLALFYRVGLPLVGRRAAMIGLSLLAVSPFYLWYSQEVRNYILLFDLGLLAIYAFLADVREKTRGTFLAAIGTSVAVCLANLTGFFLLVFHCVYVLAFRRKVHYPFRRLLLLLVVVMVALSPWILQATESMGQLHLGRPDEAAGEGVAIKGECPPGLLSIPFTFYSFSLGFSMGPSIDELKIHRWPAVISYLWYLVPIMMLFAFAFLWGFHRARRSADEFRVLLLWVTIPVLLMVALSMLNLKAPNPRYAALAFAPYLLLIGIGIASIGNRTLRALVLIALLFFSAHADYRYFTNARYWRPDTRAAGKLLRQEVRPGDEAAVYTLVEPVHYYVGDAVTLRNPKPRDFASRERMTDWLHTNVGDQRRLWIVQCMGWWLDPEDRFVHLCQEIMIPKGEWDFPKAPVYLFEVPQDWGTQNSEGARPSP